MNIRLSKKKNSSKPFRVVKTRFYRWDQDYFETCKKNVSMYV